MVARRTPPGSLPRPAADARRRWLRRAAALVLAASFLAAPASAHAAAPPTILTAGIDANDYLYATWALAPGTTFQHVDFATAPTPDPLLPDFFSSANFASFSSLRSPGKSVASTSHHNDYPLARDRRYYVRVTAAVTGTADAFLNSEIWVIDEAKPELSGRAPAGDSPATNTPASGRPFAPAGLPATAALDLQPLPRTFARLRAHGVRVAVRCTAAPCNAVATLTLGAVRIGRRTRSLAAGAAGTLVVRPSAAGTRRLRGRSRARLKISARVTPAVAAATAASRSFTVRRG